MPSHDREPKAVIAGVVRYTKGHPFPALDGYKTFSREPPFKSVMIALGINASMIAGGHAAGIRRI
ncbi:MAG TPA: hypothetical protein VM120_29710 [Bryobacteraceae bacterium]|nr:hypothetical protein [Bryobacteraceae bacterium]